MTRLVIALVLVAACSGKKQPPTTGTPNLLAKKVSLSWGFQVDGDMTDVFLATTDETAKQVSHEVGRYKGTCEKSTPAKEMNAITGATCATAAIELHAVVQDNQIIVMRMTIVPGGTPDPMAREEIRRVGVPLGAAIDAP